MKWYARVDRDGYVTARIAVTGQASAPDGAVELSVETAAALESDRVEGYRPRLVDGKLQWVEALPRALAVEAERRVDRLKRLADDLAWDDSNYLRVLRYLIGHSIALGVAHDPTTGAATRAAALDKERNIRAVLVTMLERLEALHDRLGAVTQALESARSAGELISIKLEL